MKTTKNRQAQRNDKSISKRKKKPHFKASKNSSKKLCSGQMKPDTHLGENARHIEVSDDQTTPCLFR